MRTFHLFFSLVLTIALVHSPTRADEPAMNIEQLRQQERQQIEADLRPHRSLGKMSMDQIMQARIENEMLVVSTDLPATQGPRRVDVKDVSPLCLVTVMDRPMKVLNFIARSFTRPGTVIVQTTVIARAGYLQVAEDSETPLGSRNISLIQIGANLDGVEQVVRLNVSGTDDLTNAKSVDLKLSAPTFSQLRRLYPRETAEYLMPILHDLGQEGAVFATDSLIAWQIFAEAWKPDDALREKVAATVKRLDADDFRERDRALESLQSLGQPAALMLMRADRKGLSAEQNSRIDAFLGAYRPLSDAEADRLRNSADFLIDCLNNDEPLIRQQALSRLEELFERKIDFDVTIIPQARYPAISKLRSQLLPPPATQSTMPAILE